MRDQTTILAILAVIPVIFILSGAYGFLKERNLKKQGVHVWGEVSDSATKLDRNEDYTSAPVIQYTTKDGKTFNQKYSHRSRDIFYEIGERLHLVYQPSNPSKYLVYDDTVPQSHAKMLLGAGLFALQFFVMTLVFTIYL